MQNANAVVITRGAFICRPLLLATLITVGLLAQANPGVSNRKIREDFTQPFPPHRVISNVYYVGSKGLASYLITTSQGHILINSNLESSVPLIQASIEMLGFRCNDVKILLISHAHWDHCAGSALVKELSGAKSLSNQCPSQ